jgi:hypothetical protein
VNDGEMQIMHGTEGESIVAECLPHTTKLKYFLNPTECLRMWIFADNLIIIIYKNSLSTDYIVGSNPTNAQKLSIYHDTKHHDELTRSNLKERIKTFLILSIIRTS